MIKDASSYHIQKDEAERKLMSRLELSGRSNLLSDIFYQDYIYKFYLQSQSTIPDQMTKNFTEYLTGLAKSTFVFFIFYMALNLAFSSVMYYYFMKEKLELLTILRAIDFLLICASLGCYNKGAE